MNYEEEEEVCSLEDTRWFDTRDKAKRTDETDISVFETVCKRVDVGKHTINEEIARRELAAAGCRTRMLWDGESEDRRRALVTYPHEIASKVQDDEQKARRSRTRQGFAAPSIPAP
jgi:hypothetical protein